MIDDGCKLLYNKPAWNRSKTIVQNMHHLKFLLHLLWVPNRKLMNLFKIINHRLHNAFIINRESTYEGKRYVIAQRFMGSQPSNNTQQNYKSTTKNIIRTKRKCILQLYWLLGNICNIVLSPHASTMGYFNLHTL